MPLVVGIAQATPVVLQLAAGVAKACDLIAEDLRAAPRRAAAGQAN